MTTGAKTKPAATAESNGQPATDTLTGAIASEHAIAEEAAAIRGDAEELTLALFMQLRPLLRKPIPSAFIETVGQVTGKPYESTGIKSVQVQIDRMDNVLTPGWWGDDVSYTDDGKLCHVEISVGADAERPLFTRASWGGVDRGSTQGNIRKGSYTNAAKLAFARVGPGWEIYIGAADFDPDTDEAAAKAQERSDGQTDAAERKLPAEKVEALEKIIAESGIEDQHVTAKLRSFGAKKIAELTVEQGIALWEWVSGQAKGGE